MASHKDTTICGVIESIQQTNNGGFPGKKNTKDKYMKEQHCKSFCLSAI